jgi:hypothetical protein
MGRDQQDDAGPGGPDLYRPGKDRGSHLPSLRALIIILVIVLAGLFLVFGFPPRF